MALFFKRILIFSGIIIMLFTCLEIWSRRVFRTETDLYLKFRSLERVKDSVEILIIGNSHLEKGINPQYLSQKAFNLAFSAQDLYYDHAVFNHYLNELPKLKTLIIGVDYFSFGYDESKTSMYYVRDYHKELKIKPQNGVSYLYLLNHSIFWIYRAKFMKYLLSGFPPIKPHPFSEQLEVPLQSEFDQMLMSTGYRATWTIMNDEELEQDAMTTSSRGLKLYNSEIEKRLTHYLKEIIELSLEKSIQVFLVDAPVSQYYQSALTEETKSTYSDLLKEILANYREVEYIDAKSIFNFENELFYNSNHLNVNGSERFTLYLDSIISKNQALFPYNYAD